MTTKRLSPKVSLSVTDKPGIDRTDNNVERDDMDREEHDGGYNSQGTPEPLAPALAINRVEVLELPLSAIRISDFCRRSSYDDLGGLVKSIDKNGLVQPVTVTADADGAYTLVCGSRRYRAHEQLGRTTIPCRVITVSPMEAAVLSLTENVDRADMHPVELATKIKSTIAAFGCTEQQIAERIGLSQSAVSALLGILDLDKDIQQQVSTAPESPFKRTHAEILAELIRSTRMNRKVEVRHLFQKTVKHALGTKELKGLVRLFKTGGYMRLPEQLKTLLLHDKGMTAQMAVLYLEPAHVVEGDGDNAKAWRKAAEQLDRQWREQQIIKAAKAGWSFEQTKQGLLAAIQKQASGNPKRTPEIKSHWEKMVADMSSLRDRLNVCRHEIQSFTQSRPVRLTSLCYEIQQLQSLLNDFVTAAQHALDGSSIALSVEDRSDDHDSPN